MDRERDTQTEPHELEENLRFMPDYVARDSGSIVARDGGSIVVGAGAASSGILTLPRDVLLKVFGSLDLASLMSVQCTCKDWKLTGLDPTLWTKLEIPRGRSFYFWDAEFEPLILKPKGRLTTLSVEGTGITGRSLIRFLQAGAAASEIDELNFSNCCNLKGCDILAFVEALTSVGAGFPSSFPSSSSSDATSALAIYEQSSQCATYLSYLSHRRWPYSARAPVPKTISKLRVKGCKQLIPADILKLKGRVGSVDVSVCACGKIDELKKCSKEMCQGLCGSCWGIYSECGVECGFCCEPRSAAEILRDRLHRVRRRAFVLPSRWTDVRHGAAMVLLGGV